VQSFVREQNIDAVFHYVPLHSSPAGRTFGRTPAPLPVTDHTADRLLRLPLWAGMADEQIQTVIDCVTHALVEVYAE
jgi:dTDP-4-amino-4,6-dideoxygalactose transaminase